MYSNNIVDFQESTTILNACTKKSGNLLKAPRIHEQILDETDCISHSTNTLGKGMNPIILPPVMGK